MSDEKHSHFEKNFKSLYKKGTLDWLIRFCEAEIKKDNSLCTIWTYLNALSSSILRKDLAPMNDTIKRLIRMGLSLQEEPCCLGVQQRFCEQVFIHSACHLGNEETIKLVKEFLDVPEAKENITKWHYLSRSALIAFNNFVGAGSMTPEEFDERFNALILPYTTAYFSNNLMPVNFEYDLNREIALLDLLRLYVVMREQQGNFTWAQTLEWWTNIFFDCSNPVLLVGYVSFVRSRGSAMEALEAVKFALTQISESGELEELCDMRCHLKLLKDQFDLVVTQQDPEKQIEASHDFQSKLTFYSRQYPNEFSDFVSGLTISEFHILKNSDSKMADDNERFDDEDSQMKVFVSNLSYQSTLQDLASALEEMDIHPKKIKIFKDQKTGNCRGFAHLLFKSKEQVEHAIGLSKQVKVCERILYMKQYEERPPSSSAFKSSTQSSPTLLLITNASKKFMDEKKAYATIARYGHVKDLQISVKTPESFTLKVEFHMPEDAIIVKTKITENQILGPEAKCRVGYPSKKEDAKKARKNTPKKNELESKMDVSSDDAASNPQSDNSKAEDTPKSPESPRPTREMKRTFVPRQVSTLNQPKVSKRKHMKSKLDVAVPSDISGGNSSGDLSSTSMEVETCIERERSQEKKLDESEVAKGVTKKKKLSNDDFRKFLKQ